MQPYYEYRHVVSFAETNLVGNVYFTNYLTWQGRCREMFLRDHAPDVLVALQQGLALVTVRVSCDYMAELVAFDELAIHMHLAAITQNRATMRFEYWRQNGLDPLSNPHLVNGHVVCNNRAEELVARGEQQFACMQRQGETMVATPFPPSLQAAWSSFEIG